MRTTIIVKKRITKSGARKDGTQYIRNTLLATDGKFYTAFGPKVPMAQVITEGWKVIVDAEKGINEGSMDIKKIIEYEAPSQNEPPVVAQSSVVRGQASAGGLNTPKSLSEKEIKEMLSKAHKAIDEEFKGAVSTEITPDNELMVALFKAYLKKQEEEFEIAATIWKDRIWNKR